MAVRFPLALVFAASAVLSLAACDRAADAPAGEATTDAVPAPSPTPAPAAADPGAEIDATRVVDRARAADAAPGFDVKAFAGTFAAEGAELRLAADGTYTFAVHAGSADADLVSTGTWTVDADGAGLLLDPDSKADADQRFTIPSSDELVAVVGGRVLRRDGA